MTGPLHGFRIIDVTSMVSGPSATMMLADQGADVIKVENPSGGDHTRASTNTQNGFSANFLNNNRNKRSVALNLKDPAAKQTLLKLCKSTDVFIQNFRPGVVDRMGIGEADIRAVAPDIVYVSISGFGETGPYAGTNLSCIARLLGSESNRPTCFRRSVYDSQQDEMGRRRRRD